MFVFFVILSRGSLVHLDISTPNIVLDEWYNARLIDFGLCEILKDNKIPSARKNNPLYFGTNGYWPYKHKEDTDARNLDFHSFGVGWCFVLEF